MKTENQALWLVFLVGLLGYGNASQGSNAIPAAQAVGASDTTPPSVHFTFPAAGTAVSGLSPIDALSLDNIATSRVDLYADNVLMDLARDGRPPESTDGTAYHFNFNTLQFVNGNHTLRAVAVDTSGHSAQTTLSVNIQNPAPVTTGTFTPATTTAIAGQQVLLVAQNTPNVKICDCESFYHRMLTTTGGSAQIGDQNRKNNTIKVFYTAPATPGVYKVRFGSIDSATVFIESTITVTADSQAPVVHFTAPSNTLTGNVLLRATATDNAAIAGMQFLLDGAPVGSMGQSGILQMAIPLNTTLIANGTHTLAVKAWDPAGNSSTSAPATVQIQNAAPPVRDRAFEAPAQTSGQITVKLYPTEVVTPGSTRTVTFGVPFSRGSLLPADLTKVRVLKNGVEIPAYVEMLTPWRHLKDPALNGTHVRVARIQIKTSFTVDNRSDPAIYAAESVTVEWGQHNRTLNLPSLSDPKLAWHTATSGSFVAADGVTEPDVFAVLPADWLCQGVLKPGRMLPIEASIPETIMNPASIAAEPEHPGAYRVKDLHLHNWFYTLINQDDPRITLENQIHYKEPGDYEPWLYDRASTMFVDYFRSGTFKPLREAVRASQFYASKLDANGFFTINTDAPQDPKYSYAEPMAYTLWLTGDRSQVTTIKNVLHAFNDYDLRWGMNQNFWTERHTGFRLLAYAINYELFGATDVKTRLNTDIASLIWHQNGAGGQIPKAGRVDGGLYHTGDQHAGDANNWEFIASPWMSILVLDPMLRVYGLGAGDNVGHFIQRLGNFEKAGVKVTNHYLDDSEGLSQPDYITRYNGITSGEDDGNCEHTHEAAAILAWAGYFAEHFGTPDPSFYQVATENYYASEANVRYWTRPDAPPLGYSAYRVTPARKYGWQERATNSLSWLMP